MNKFKRNLYFLEITYFRFWNNLFISAWVFLAIKTSLSICIILLKEDLMYLCFSNFVLLFERKKKRIQNLHLFCYCQILLVKSFIAKKEKEKEVYC